jgi:hypothetical protein
MFNMEMRGICAIAFRVIENPHSGVEDFRRLRRTHQCACVGNRLTAQFAYSLNRVEFLSDMLDADPNLAELLGWDEHGGTLSEGMAQLLRQRLMPSHNASILGMFGTGAQIDAFLQDFPEQFERLRDAGGRAFREDISLNFGETEVARALPSGFLEVLAAKGRSDLLAAYIGCGERWLVDCVAKSAADYDVWLALQRMKGSAR